MGSAKKFLSSYARVKLRSVYEQYRRLMLRRPHELGFIRGIRIKHKKNYQHESVDTVHDHGRKDERRPREAPLDVSLSKPPKSGQKNSNFCQILLQKKSNSDKDDHVLHVLSHS